MRRGAFRLRWGRKAWYLAPTILNGVVSLSAVPVLILCLGAAGWAEIALGQAIGLFGSVFIGLGWPVLGPAIIARSSSEDRYAQFLLSLCSRIIVALFVTVMTFILFLCIAPDRGVLMITAIVSNLLACTSSWYFLGTDDPKGLFWRDAVVRGVGSALGLAAVAASGYGEFFAVGIFVGIVISIFLTHTRARSQSSGGHALPTLSEAFRSIRSQGSGFAANVFFVALSTMALPLTAIVGGPVFVVFAVLDKVQKQLTTVALPATQYITGKMAGDLGRGASPVRTANRLFYGTTISGLILALVMVPLGPWAVELMSAGAIDVDVWQTISLALVVGLAFITQCLPTAVLAPIGQIRYGIFGMLASILLGIPLIVYAGSRWGITAVMLSLSVMYFIPIISSFVAVRIARKNSISEAPIRNSMGGR